MNQINDQKEVWLLKGLAKSIKIVEIIRFSGLTYYGQSNMTSKILYSSNKNNNNSLNHYVSYGK